MMVQRLLFAFGISWASAVIASSSAPTVIREGRELIGRPSDGVKTLGQNLSVLESERCQVAQVSAARLKVSAHCEYARGVYLYKFEMLSGEDHRAKEVMVEFAVNQQSPDGFALWVGSPIQIRR